jgi:hypothetical protein
MASAGKQSTRSNQLAFQASHTSSRSRSSSLSFTMYLFTALCFAVTMHLRRCGAIDSEIHRKIKDERH